MKKKFFFAALATIALASCTNDESVFEGIAQGDEINFAVAKYTPQTRANEHETGADFTENVTIWSWYDGNSTQVIPGDVYDPVNNVFVPQNGATTGNKYYWPVDNSSLDFVAVPTSLITDGYFTAPERNGGNTTLTFELDGNTYYHTTNLMTTQVLTGNRTESSVALLFRHLLAKLNINVNQKVRANADADADARWNVTINSITLSGLHNYGKVVIDDAWTAANNDANCAWDETRLEQGNSTWNVKSAQDWSLYDDTNPATTALAANATANNYSSSETYYILPQSLVNQEITIKYTIVTDYLGNPTQPNTVETYTKTFKLAGISNIYAWYMNKVITYNIAIDPTEELNPITFDVNEEVWGTETGNAADLGIN
ncbi:MAG: fimbrillin family protein [Bacteroidaceae bacterium]|nr:fimbrillin family protein [Bacteroidaceae bacterium]